MIATGQRAFLVSDARARARQPLPPPTDSSHPQVGPATTKSCRGEGSCSTAPDLRNAFRAQWPEDRPRVPAGPRKVPALLDAHVREAEDSHYCGVTMGPATTKSCRGEGSCSTAPDLRNAFRARSLIGSPASICWRASPSPARRSLSPIWVASPYTPIPAGRRFSVTTPMVSATQGSVVDFREQRLRDRRLPPVYSEPPGPPGGNRRTLLNSMTQEPGSETNPGAVRRTR